MDGTCALLTDGSVYCWGSKFDTNAPTEPISGLTDPVERFGGGSGHTFFCVRNGDGTVQSWGNNRFGQLGNGIATLASDFTTTPVTASGLTDITGVARGVGNAGACVNHATGELSCWGRGEYGVLGFPASQTCHSTPNQPTPTQVPEVANVAKVALGHRNTCALFDNGTVDCWGNNTAGPLGQAGGGTGPGDLVVGLPRPATGIVACTYHACALVSGTDYMDEPVLAVVHGIP
jgi:alpha-tubulin suppressor-like RCC1 family protein